MMSVFDALKFFLSLSQALAGVRSSSALTGKYMEVNYSGTQLLLDLAASHKVTQFVFAFTSSVYGQTEQLPFVETDSCAQPLSPYAATKRAAEIMAHVYHYLHGLHVSVLRLFNVYGPRGRPDMMPFKLMRACVDPKFTVDVFDDGEIRRDWTYVDNVIDGFIAALEKTLAMKSSILDVEIQSSYRHSSNTSTIFRIKRSSNERWCRTRLKHPSPIVITPRHSSSSIFLRRSVCEND